MHFTLRLRRATGPYSQYCIDNFGQLLHQFKAYRLYLERVGGAYWRQLRPTTFHGHQPRVRLLQVMGRRKEIDDCAGYTIIVRVRIDNVDESTAVVLAAGSFQE